MIIGHLLVHFSLFFIVGLSAKSFVINFQFSFFLEVESNNLNSNFKLRLALKKEIRGSQKRSIQLLFLPFHGKFGFCKGRRIE